MTHKKLTHQPQKWQKLVNKFQHTSDRAAVILGATQLEIRLGRLISCFLVDNQETQDYLLKSSGPLGCFKARIESAYGMGIISPNEYHDLGQISQVRDLFLDEANGGKFTDDGIREKCYVLKMPRDVLLPDRTTTPRRLFLFATTLLLKQIIFRSKQAEQQRRKPPENFMLLNGK
ncbi:MAG: MltR family transcriptional regulator [Chloroflexota bacterium]|nr:MltR family transcriptional regulator [Chloroflexota bacterium]